MELVNQTGLSAALRVSKSPHAPRDLRAGILIAKATFLVDGNGAVRLETADPFPIAVEDEETELGLLPIDTYYREGPALEVMLLGAAYGPPGKSISDMRVKLEIADRVSRIRVFGDRFWVGSGDDAPATAPAPFTRLPLTWERAFGGSADVHLDANTVLEVVEPRNPFGRGFDPEPMAKGFAATMGVPEGFPRWEQLRTLPNLEHPDDRIKKYSDRPLPYCWAPRPIPMSRLISETPTRPEDIRPVTPREAYAGIYRASPDLVLPEAPLGAPVRVSGVLPSGGVWAFAFPTMSVLADYVLGARTGTKPLVPQTLVLLPEQSRFYVVYKMDFRMKAEETDERSFRLRLA